MNYPLISEYIEAIKAAEDNFEQLKNLRPVLDEDGEPIMTSGNFAVVFKMKDEQTGKLHAVKCFLKEQEGRAEAYRMIAEELEYVSSTFLTPIKYLDKELFVDSNASDETEFPVLLMDWVEGQTLDKYIREHISDDFELLYLSYQFSQFAMWLMPQPFAHGDLKPDNILVKEGGEIVLVDYDGMYVPAMKGQKARELGSPDFRHPLRTEYDFDEHIDDFSIISILVSLKAITMQPNLLEKYGARDRLLFSQNDYNDLLRCQLLKELYPSEDSELNILLSLFTIAYVKGNLAGVSFNLLDLPKTSEIIEEATEEWFRAMEEEMAPYKITESWSLDAFIKEFNLTRIYEGTALNPVNLGGDDAFYFVSKDGKEIVVFNVLGLTMENVVAQNKDISIVLSKSGQYTLCGYSTKTKDDEFQRAYTDEKGVMYSQDKKKLIGVYGFYLPEYLIDEGTEVICDDALNGVWREDDSGFFVSWRKENGLLVEGTITIPSSVRFIGRNPFSGDYKRIICNSPYFAVEDDALFTIDIKRLISCFSKKSEFVVPDGVKQIGSFAFKGCNVERIIIPESVWYIGENPFVEMNLANNIILEVICNSHNFFVKGNALYRKEPQKLISYWGKSQVVYIEAGTIVIEPYSLNSSVNKIYLPESIQIISSKALNGKSLEQLLIIPRGTKKKFEELFPHYKDKLMENLDDNSVEVTEEDFVNAWIDEYGVLYSRDGTRLLSAPQDITLLYYSIRNGTEIICNNAFSGHTELKVIGIPYGIKAIGDNAFSSCESIVSLNMPNSITQIGKYAFGWCEGLEYIILSESIKEIREGTFYACNSLATINIPLSVCVIESSAFYKCGCLENITIPSNVTCIGDEAFGNCANLRTVHIDNGNIRINNSVFSRCDNLDSIYIPHGMRGRFDIILGDYNNIICEPPF